MKPTSNEGWEDKSLESRHLASVCWWGSPSPLPPSSLWPRLHAADVPRTHRLCVVGRRRQEVPCTPSTGGEVLVPGSDQSNRLLRAVAARHGHKAGSSGWGGGRGTLWRLFKEGWGGAVWETDCISSIDPPGSPIAYFSRCTHGWGAVGHLGENYEKSIPNVFNNVFNLLQIKSVWNHTMTQLKELIYSYANKELTTKQNNALQKFKLLKFHPQSHNLKMTEIWTTSTSFNLG